MTGTCKAVGGLRDSGDFTVSRNGRAEYAVPCPAGTTGDCLPQERVPLARVSDDQIFFGSVRFDKYLRDGTALTMRAASQMLLVLSFRLESAVSNCSTSDDPGLA